MSGICREPRAPRVATTAWPGVDGSANDSVGKLRGSREARLGRCYVEARRGEPLT
jgi:hypothetical protein